MSMGGYSRILQDGAGGMSRKIAVPYEAIERAQRISADPDAASDSEKLRSVADFLDIDDTKHERTGDELQVFLRDLADRLEPKRKRRKKR